MSDLFDKSIRTLELPRVLELLSEQAVSAEARQRALRIRPETEPEEVLRLLDQTDAARNLIGLRGSPSFSGVKPVAEALDRADRGGALNTRELLTIADLLTAARRAKEYFNDEAAEKTAIDHLFLSLHGNRFLEEKIKRAIPDEDTIADAASTELADIRRHMRAAQAKSRQILQKIISSPSYGKILQETIITQRDGRFVVPVKATCRDWSTTSPPPEPRCSWSLWGWSRLTTSILSCRPRSRRRSTASWRSSPPRLPPTGRTSSGTTTPWSTWT